MIFTVGRARLLKALLIFSAILGFTLLWFGNWPLQLIRQPFDPVASHKLFVNLFPYQVPVAVALVIFGLRRKDETMYLAASPFFSPYVPMTALLGPWLAVISWAKDRDAVLIWLVMWAAFLFRSFVH